jgi:hypothetical protein
MYENARVLNTFFEKIRSPDELDWGTFLKNIPLWEPHLGA